MKRLVLLFLPTLFLLTFAVSCENSGSSEKPSMEEAVSISSGSVTDLNSIDGVKGTLFEVGAGEAGKD